MHLYVRKIQLSFTLTHEYFSPLPSSQVNPERIGYYRVSYASDLFSPLLPALTNATLSPQDRLGLQNDAFALVCKQETKITFHLSIHGCMYNGKTQVELPGISGKDNLSFVTLL